MMDVCNLLFTKVVGNGIEFSQIPVVRDHFCGNG